MTEKTFSDEVRHAMHEASAGYCACSLSCTRVVTEFDHILPNSIPNNDLFPLFINSPFNCLPINRRCHEQKGKITISLNQAKVYEDYLEKIRGEG